MAEAVPSAVFARLQNWRLNTRSTLALVEGYGVVKMKYSELSPRHAANEGCILCALLELKQFLMADKS